MATSNSRLLQIPSLLSAKAHCMLQMHLHCGGIIIIIIMIICAILIFIWWTEGGCCNDMRYIVIVSMKRKRLKTTWTQIWLDARKYNVCKKLQGPDNVKACIQSDVKPLPPSTPTHPPCQASPVHGYTVKMFSPSTYLANVFFILKPWSWSSSSSKRLKC